MREDVRHTAPHPTEDRVLIITGGLLSVKDRSVVAALKKQIASYRASSAAWLDAYYKVIGAENLIALRRFQRSRAFRAAPYRAQVERYFADDRHHDAPELAEVVLATLLEAEGLGWEATTVTDLFADEALRERLLGSCGCVFVSSTLLRDLSELQPLVALVKRAHNHVVVGGALATLLADRWEPNPYVDLVAAGYGERLVPSLAAWIRSGYTTLEPPPGGRLEQRGGTPILRSGVPASHHLDALPTPDWQLAERYHRQRFPMVHYESMRGCPHNCRFCSYPYLFDDRLCRFKSAERIVQEWLGYAAHGVRWVMCLDSTFTVPRKRLRKVCEGLIDAGSPLRWICYARGDDLAEPGLCELMARAGCHQVQIGVESGSATILANMDKRCSLEQSHAGIANCRRAGISSFVTVILGFPGETPATIRDSYAFIRDAAPDFAYPTPFTTRVEFMPILQPEHRERFGLRTAGGSHSGAPYWRHDSMSCEEVGHWQHWFLRQMMLDRAALECSLFYKGMLTYHPRDRETLLDFQRDVAQSQSGLRALFAGLRHLTSARLEREVRRTFG